MGNQEKVFVGNAKAKVNKFNEKEVSIGLTADDLKKLESHLNAKGWVNVTLKSSKDGKPYLQIDTWQPKEAVASVPATENSDVQDGTSDDLPF